MIDSRDVAIQSAALEAAEAYVAEMEGQGQQVDVLRRIRAYQALVAAMNGEEDEVFSSQHGPSRQTCRTASRGSPATEASFCPRRAGREEGKRRGMGGNWRKGCP